MYHPINLTATSHGHSWIAWITKAMPRPQAPQLQRHLSEGNEVDAPRVGHWKPTRHGKMDGWQRWTPCWSRWFNKLIVENLRIIQFLKEHFEIGQVFRGFIVSCRWNSQLFWWFFGRFSYSELRHGMRHDQVISWICFLSVFWYNSYVFLCFWLYIIILPFDMSAFLPRDSYLLNHDLRNISLFGHSFELGDFEGTPTCWLSMRICSIVFFQVNTFWFDWVQIFWFFLSLLNMSVEKFKLLRRPGKSKVETTEISWGLHFALG